MKNLGRELKAQAYTDVHSQNTAEYVKSGSLPVFATPMMIALMEQATCAACEPLLDEGETTVGTKINISHKKASPVGAVITAYASLKEIDGRRLVFSVSAKDDNGDIIGSGTIERFVVITDKFMKKVGRK